MSQTAKVLILVEGSSHGDLRNRDLFQELWQRLYRQAGGNGEILIKGFSKDQLVALDPPITSPFAFRRERLDILISRTHAEKPFSQLIVAFDASPSNEFLSLPCMRTEVNFLLKALSKSAVLSADLSEAAHRQLSYYRTPRKKTPRGPGRPPRDAVEVLYMNTSFESLLASDERALMRVLGHTTRPQAWPRFSNEKDPVALLEAAVATADENVRRRIRGGFRENRHGWADYILREAPKTSGLWRHEIFERLVQLV